MGRLQEFEDDLSVEKKMDMEEERRETPGQDKAWTKSLKQEKLI